MYINKVVFVESEDVKPLKKYDVIIRTDYDTTEIIGDMIIDRLAQLEAEPNEFDYTKEEFEQDMKGYLGTDLYEMLVKGEVDFCLVA